MNETTNASRNRDGIEIDVRKLILAWLRKWWVIILAAAVCAVGALYYTMHYITPMYRASVTVYVNNSSADEHIDYFTSSNLNASQNLVNTYVSMIKSDTVLRKVADAINDPNVTSDYIRKSLTASQVQDTVMFNVYISNPDPRMATNIANTIADIAPAEIAEFVEGSSTKIVDYARIPQTPYTPSKTRNTLIGGFIGAAAAMFFIALRFMMDVRIKDEEDLTSLYNLPILGQIPFFDVKNPGKKSGGGYRAEGYTSARN